MKILLRLVIGIAIVAAVVYFVVLKPVPVQSHTVARGTVVREALGSGSIESRRLVGVGFEVTARVAEIYVDQGDKVTANQVLARLDDRTFQAAVALARQEVALVESTIQRLEADIERAKAVLEGARDGLRRIIPLVEEHTASEEQLDIAREREKVAVAELARAEAALIEGRAATSVAQSKLESAQVELARTVLHSPFDGTVILREREVGDVAVPGAPVLRLAASDTIWASVWVDESHLDSLRVNLPARIVLRSEPEHSFRGQVARIGREVDRETRELLVDVGFQDPPDHLVFGQRVDLWIELSRASETLRIPAGLLVHVDGRQGVFVNRRGRARFEEIEVGLVGTEFFEVVSGLEEGTTVLFPRTPKHALKDGDRIELVDASPLEGQQ